MSVLAERSSASFRDPSGFVFSRDGEFFRQVNRVYQPEYDRLMNSGLYDQLTREGYLLPHEEANVDAALEGAAYKILRPQQLPFVSYPYEWSFSQLKDAALLTLRLQRMAMGHGLTLKDASAYNIQLHDGRPVFIDTLSFEGYDATKPWVAYRQFCQHFLAPLALMAHTDIGLGQLLRVHIDGIPLPLARKLLPWRTRFNMGLGLHLHLHARAQVKYANRPEAAQQRSRRAFSQHHLEALLASLEATIVKLEWRGDGTEWGDYYEANNNYGDQGLATKERIVGELVAAAKPETVWDLGANTGRFSRVAAATGPRMVVSWDIDPACVEANYRQVSRRREKSIVPVLLDLTNPSPAMGWNHRERQAFAERGPVDLGMALGLVHHLAISNNVPLANVASFFHGICRSLLIEWVPKEDSQVQRLLASRKDVFPAYSQAGFEHAFEEFFEVVRVVPVEGTRRTLYLMKGA